jgi:hypothetical protein
VFATLSRHTEARYPKRATRRDTRTPLPCLYPGPVLLIFPFAPVGANVCVCLLLQDLVQSCLHGGGGDMGGHVLRETTSRGLCGLVCPSRTSERRGEGDCVKDGRGMAEIVLIRCST